MTVITVTITQPKEFEQGSKYSTSTKKAIFYFNILSYFKKFKAVLSSRCLAKTVCSFTSRGTKLKSLQFSIDQYFLIKEYLK